jgi:uncharacterized membrane protein YhaH (DUF805 family)
MNPNMTPIDWAKRPIEKYAEFSGRAPRAEYWWFVLALIVAFIIVSIIESIVSINHMILGVYGPLSALLWVGTLVPSIAVGVRRLHDTNRTGWWILLPIIPYCLALVLGGAALMGGGGSMAGAGIAAIFLLIGGILALVLIVFLVLPSTPGDNRYGPNPYGEGASAVPAE